MLEERPLPADALFEILANPHRRALLAFLRNQPDGTASIEAATEQIITEVGRERDTRPVREEVRVDLHHNHVPKLAAAGVVEYDGRSQTIRYHPNERLDALFDCVQELQKT